MEMLYFIIFISWFVSLVIVIIMSIYPFQPHPVGRFWWWNWNPDNTLKTLYVFSWLFVIVVAVAFIIWQCRQ
jgi:hypothetical protein